MIIDTFDETGLLKEDKITYIYDLLQFAAKKQDITNEAELSVTFVDDDRIREINREYRSKDMPTDVISFAMEELGEGETIVYGDDLPVVLGDIIISVPRAQEQSERFGHTFIRELGFLSVHGLLHLLGYDHMNEEDEAKMFKRQREILDEYGLQR
jgi:probable rRNA maturation factor